MLDPEVMGEMFGKPRVREHPLVKNHDRAVVGEILEAVGHRDHEAVPATGKLAEQGDNFLLGLRIQPARHLVTEQDRGTADQLHGQRQTPFLAAREDLDHALAEFIHPDLTEETGDHFLPLIP